MSWWAMKKVEPEVEAKGVWLVKIVPLQATKMLGEQMRVVKEFTEVLAGEEKKVFIHLLRKETARRIELCWH